MNAIAKLLAAAGRRPAVSFGPKEDYAAYLAAVAPDDKELERQRGHESGYSPRFRIALLGEPRQATLDSLKNQTYPNWTLDDHDYDYIIHLLPGDKLTPDALFEFSRAAESLPQAMYADEDEQSGEGRTNPVFKPDVSEYTLLSYDCVGRPLAVARAVHEKAGGPHGASLAEQYGYALRVFAITETMLHLRRVLCSCLPRPPEDARMQVKSYLEQKRLPGCVLGGIWRGSYRVMCAKACRVGVVIPDKDASGLRRLLESLEHCTVYDSFEIAIVDRGSRDARRLRYYEVLKRNKAAKIIHVDEQGLSAAFNRGAKLLDAEVTVFAAPYCEMISPAWLSALVEPIARGAAAAGPKLVDAEGRLLHAGGVVGIRGWAMSPYAYAPDDTREQRKNLFINTLRTVTTLSSACMAVDTARFFDIGCFDESFSICGQAEELCLRLYRASERVVYTPFSLVRCHDRAGGFTGAPESDLTRCYDVMRPMLSHGDPYYNPGFDYNSPLPKAAPPRAAITLNPLYG